MANWCFNMVQFEGDTHQIKEVEQLFAAMAAREQKQQCGQLPDFAKQHNGYFFSIRWEEDVLYYETKWCPNTEQLLIIADHFNVGFIHDYEESGMQIYGQSTYRNGILTTVDLDPEDYDLFEYDEEQNNYLFEGERYPSEFEIFEILLERKKQ